jgi:hypothetical protein
VNAVGEVAIPRTVAKPIVCPEAGKRAALYMRRKPKGAWRFESARGHGSGFESRQVPDL